MSKTHPTHPKTTSGRIVRIATAVLAGAVIATLPVTADARPTTDQFSGSPDRRTCHVTAIRDRGYEYTIIVTERQRILVDGEWVRERVQVTKTVTALPRSGNYTLVSTEDLGVIRYLTCGYQR